MSTYIIELATSTDNKALCLLCAIPMKGNISLSFERSPDFFAASGIQCENAEVYVCRKKSDNHLYGVFSVGKRRVFYQNKIQTIRYFSDLRIHPDVQGARLLYQITRFITDHNLLEDSFAQTIVFADNTLMLKLVDSLNRRAGKMSIFKYYPAGDYVSFMVKPTQFKLPQKDKIYIAKATQGDIGRMNAFVNTHGKSKKFFPLYDFSQLGTLYYKGLSIEQFYLATANEEIVGIAGVWDQKTIKQTRVYGYSKLYGSLRPIVNLYASITGGLALPSIGTAINYLALHCILIKKNDTDIFKRLLQKISNDFYKSGYDSFLIGFDEKDSLVEALSIFKHKRTIKGKHFLVSTKELTNKEVLSSPYYLETARI